MTALVIGAALLVAFWLVVRAIAAESADTSRQRNAREPTWQQQVDEWKRRPTVVDEASEADARAEAERERRELRELLGDDEPDDDDDGQARPPE